MISKRFSVVALMSLLLASADCGVDAPRPDNLEAGGAGGSAGAGGAGGDGGGGSGGVGGGRACAELTEESTSFVAVSVENADEFTDLSFALDGCELEVVPAADTSCSDDAQYYLKVPNGPVAITVSSSRDVRWRFSVEGAEGGCSNGQVSLENLTSMIRGLGIMDSESTPKFRFPVDVRLDGKVIGKFERFVDMDEFYSDYVEQPVEMAMINRLFRMQDAGYLVVVPINDVPHVLEYSQDVGSFRQEFEVMDEGFISVGMFGG